MEYCFHDVDEFIKNNSEIRLTIINILIHLCSLDNVWAVNPILSDSPRNLKIWIAHIKTNIGLKLFFAFVIEQYLKFQRIRQQILQAKKTSKIPILLQKNSIQKPQMSSTLDPSSILMSLHPWCKSRKSKILND